MRYPRLIVALVLWSMVCPSWAADPATARTDGEPLAFEMAVYLSAVPQRPSETVATLCAKEFPHFKYADARLATVASPLVTVRLPPIDEYAPPDESSLKYSGRGLSPEQTKTLLASKAVIAVSFLTRDSRDLKTVEQANRLMLRLAEQTGGILWDEETREVFSNDYWKTHRIDTWQDGLPRVAEHITIHLYRPGRRQLLRAITLGMAKFGCPDVVINDLTVGDSQSAGGLINLVCQTLVESALPKGKTIAVDVAKLRHRGCADSIRKSYQEGATGRADLSSIRSTSCWN
jgi:hypothetical protein